MSITPLEPGATAPSFALLDEGGQVRRREEWDGQWLCVWWNPVALAKGCKSCGQKIVDAVRPLSDAGVALVGITMHTPAENAERSLFVFESLFPILSADHATAAAWGAARPQESPWAGVPHPVCYLVNPQGRIEQSWLVTHHTGRQHIDEVVNVVLGALV